MFDKKEITYPYHLIEGVSVPLNITNQKLDILKKLTLKKGDICVVSHPRSGSNWLMRIITLLLCKGEIQHDKTATNSIIYADSYLIDNIDKIDFESFPSPRLFKMHLPYNFGLGGVPTQTQCKYLYIARNPKDVVASYYFFEKSQNWWGKSAISWDTWIEMFIEGISHRGPWSDHVISWWKHSLISDNILFIKYEDLIKNYDFELERIAKFLNISLTSTIHKKLKEKTKIDYMKKDPFYLRDHDKLYNNIINKGGAGSWSNLFTDDQNKKIYEYYQKNVFSLGLKLDFF